MRNLAVLLSTGFGVGYLPGLPGTYGSLATLPFGYLILTYGGTTILLAAAVIVSLIGIWASGTHAQAIGRKDPGSSVIDEVAGQLLAMLPISVAGDTSDIVPVVIAFFLFRLFDILKPWPISRFERFHGGLGIMADDIAAGLVSAALLYAALALGWI
jgi:phosphatidylglycerophosphatase A